MGVEGIGGFFFRARDPEALKTWYRTHLGVESGGAWQQAAGTTVFMPFPQKTEYFAQDHAWMLNLRVQDLDGLIAQLKAAGIAVETRADWDDPVTGRFARIHDPEDNPIELWQPPED